MYRLSFFLFLCLSKGNIDATMKLIRGEGEKRIYVDLISVFIGWFVNTNELLDAKRELYGQNRTV